jgi:hypothetical protein
MNLIQNLERMDESRFYQYTKKAEGKVEHTEDNVVL